LLVVALSQDLAHFCLLGLKSFAVPLLGRFVVDSRVPQLLWALSFYDDCVRHRLLGNALCLFGASGLDARIRVSRQVLQLVSLKVLVLLFALLFILLRVFKLVIEELQVMQYIVRLLVLFLYLPKEGRTDLGSSQLRAYSLHSVLLVISMLLI